MIILIKQDINARIEGVAFKGPAGKKYPVASKLVRQIARELKDAAVDFEIMKGPAASTPDRNTFKAEAPKPQGQVFMTPADEKKSEAKAAAKKSSKGKGKKRKRKS